MIYGSSVKLPKDGLLPFSTVNCPELKVNALESFLGSQAEKQHNKHYHDAKSYLLDKFPAWASNGDSSWSH